MQTLTTKKWRHKIACLHSECSGDLLTLITDSTDPTRTKFAAHDEHENDR